jgi:CDP-diacylglycerol---glycerol-3-phosphate 3-phosphatidyltransferase
VNAVNLPNRLTMFRIILIPFLIALHLISNGDYGWFAGMGIVFAIASATDFLDGHLARKHNLVTTFGKFMDPLADKLLVMAALLLLTAVQNEKPWMWMPYWVPLIVLSRELVVTSIRLVAVGDGKIIAASMLGKAKTFVTMAAILYYFFVMPWNVMGLNIVGYVLVGASVLLTLWSGIDYFLQNKAAIFASK